jgi:queuine/archaeosine tRNA-ribosyltransferase
MRHREPAGLHSARGEVEQSRHLFGAGAGSNISATLAFGNTAYVCTRSQTRAARRESCLLSELDRHLYHRDTQAKR